MYIKKYEQKIFLFEGVNLHQIMLIYKLRKICQEDIVLESIRTVIDFVNNLLWGKNILVVMLIGTAVYFTFKTRFMQFRLFGDII